MDLHMHIFPVIIQIQVIFLLLFIFRFSFLVFYVTYYNKLSRKVLIQETLDLL